MLNPERLNRLRKAARVSLLELSDDTGINRLKLHRFEHRGATKLSAQEEAAILDSLTNRYGEAIAGAKELRAIKDQREAVTA